MNTNKKNCDGHGLSDTPISELMCFPKAQEKKIRFINHKAVCPQNRGVEKGWKGVESESAQLRNRFTAPEMSSTTLLSSFLDYVANYIENCPENYLKNILTNSFV